VSPWEAPRVRLFIPPEKIKGGKRGALLHRALTLRDLSVSGNGVGHSPTRWPAPAHGTNPVSLWETDELSDGNGVCTPPKPPSTVRTAASFLVARPVGRSVFIPSPTKVPAPTRCEQQTLPTAANTARAHVPLNSRAALAVPQGASSLRNPWDTPPSKQEQRMRKRQSAETNMPSPEKHINTILAPAQQFLVPSTLHSVHPHLFQRVYLPMTVRRILSLTLVQ